MSAWSNSTCTWVEVSSTDTSVSIQRRETTSMMAKATRLARGKWVASQHQMRFGAHSSQSGQPGLGVGSRTTGSGSTSP